MDISLFQAAAGMNASARWQEIIADNLSASQIPGFKKQDLSFSAVAAGFMPQAPGGAGGLAQRFSMPVSGSSINFQAGELQPTGVNTDFGIEGPGFFEVQLNDGTSAYTRDGEFRVSAQGQLLTKQGLPVMGDSGPIQLDANSAAPISVAPNGDVTQGSVKKGHLKVVDFPDTNVLVPNGAGLFVTRDVNYQPPASQTSFVRQGMVEHSNISTMVEMGNLITAMRFYEANDKVIQNEDDRTSKLIAQVANPSA